MHDTRSMVAVMIRMPEEMRDKLAALAARRGETTSVVIREALRLYLEQHAKADRPPPGGD
jgi:predicted DNA-binding protein